MAVTFVLNNDQQSFSYKVKIQTFDSPNAKKNDRAGPGKALNHAVKEVVLLRFSTIITLLHKYIYHLKAFAAYMTKIILKFSFGLSVSIFNRELALPRG